MEKVLDARGLKCPMPIVKAKKEIDALDVEGVLKVLATDRGSVLDMQGWAKMNPKIALLKQETQTDEQGREIYVHWLQRKP